MSEYIRIAVDAMGGDNAPSSVVEGTLEALKENDRIAVYLVGKEEAVKSCLAGKSYDQDRLSVVNATEVIENDDHPALAIKKKKDSSMTVALRMVHDGKADAFVSAGNTGAVLVGGQLLVGRLHGIRRPALAPLIPTMNGVALLIDCGANVDAKPENLVQFAKMGSIYMSEIMGVKDPRVGLVNIGAEETKGNRLVQEVYPMLKSLDDINFVGNVEARDIPAGAADVLVCEAFTGNVILKMYEGVAGALIATVKKAMMSSLKTKIGALLIKDELKATLKVYDTSEHGGAPLLGLNNLVVKAHGSSKAKEIKNTLLQCVPFYEKAIPARISAAISSSEEEA